MDMVVAWFIELIKSIPYLPEEIKAGIFGLSVALIGMIVVRLVWELIKLLISSVFFFPTNRNELLYFLLMLVVAQVFTLFFGSTGFYIAIAVAMVATKYQYPKSNQPDIVEQPEEKDEDQDHVIKRRFFGY